MRRALLASVIAAALVNVTPVAAEVIATKADCEGMATATEMYAGIVSAFRHSAASLMIGENEVQDRWPDDIKRSIVELAASRDAVLPTLDAFLKALNESTAVLHECAGAVDQ